MKRRFPIRLMIISTTVIALSAIVIAIYTSPSSQAGADDDPAVKVALTLRGVEGNPRLLRLEDNTYRYAVELADGSRAMLTPDEFSARLHDSGADPHWWARFFNISSPLGVLWIAIGLFGQMLFTGRMVVQWLASEKKRRSIVPVAFWWMSLFGATMLMAYFIWRNDIIGMLGQGTGWFIYVRNLWLIYRPNSEPGLTTDPAPEATLQTKRA